MKQIFSKFVERKQQKTFNHSKTLQQKLINEVMIQLVTTTNK